MKLLRSILVICLIAVLPQRADAQRKAPEDSVFRLVKADRAQQVTEYGVDYRRVVGNANFRHNQTTLLCDSASWNLQTNIIEAYGNVRLKQEGTTLTSDEMSYFIDSDLAEFSGPLVELVDKEKNVLRTGSLEYNTKDSTAVFHDGGAMKDKDGNVIESVTGTYDSKFKTFLFEENVKLYMDSIFLSTTEMTYLADSSKALFGPETRVWKDKGFVRADSGWYDRKDSTVFFTENVYCKDDDYESWSEEAWYFSRDRVVEMYNNVRVLDSAQCLVLLGNKLRYEQDSSRAYLLEDPAVVHYGKDSEGKVDTLFMRADSLIFHGVKKCCFPEDELAAAKKRREDVLFDALQELRNKQAEERNKKIEEGLRAAGKLPPLIDSTKNAAADSVASSSVNVAEAMETPESQSDTLAVAPATDSISVSAPPDTTEIKILTGLHNFKAYRRDMQMKSDSVRFTTLDSIVVLTGRPILWSSEKTQMTSDVMHLLVKDGGIYRGSMLDDARMVSRETETYFDQIRSTEMMGFFRNNKLYRFDALGQVTAIIYMDEDGKLTNVNLKEAKSMTAMIKNDKAQRMLYLEEIKSDAFPVLQLEKDRHRLKGFEWRGEERPASRFDITGMTIPRSIRAAFSFVSKPEYNLTDEYFDGYMTKVYESIRLKEEEARRRAAEEARVRDSLHVADSLRIADSLEVVEDVRVEDSLRVADSLATVKPAADTSSKASQIAPSKEDKKLTAKERRAARKLARAERRKARIEARAARRKAKAEARAARKKARAEARADKPVNKDS